MVLNINGRPLEVPAEWRDESLLHVLREPLGLPGTKYGCDIGLCGACTDWSVPACRDRRVAGGSN